MSERAVSKAKREDSWPVRANALLLVIHAVGLVGISAYGIWQINWQRLQEASSNGRLPELAQNVEHAVITALVFVPPALLALLAALGFLFILRAGWLLAMISQGATLLACLLLYTAWTPVFIYPVMVYCSAMVGYLNSSVIRTAFQVRPRKHLGGSRVP